jgi:RimJ/RimL family protein N-acetyltransferase
MKESIRREVIYTEGKYKDEILFGLTKKEFNKREKKENFNGTEFL